ncbi:MAG: 5'-methylthioadenosine/S-adenosylhomocysteine nucleosidase [Candidatus Cryptobacteroides sp.]
MKVGLIVAMESEQQALRSIGIDNAVLSGIGKVNAAIAATQLILKDKPDCIISSGVAGGIDKVLKIGDFVLANQVAYHDVWCGEGNLLGQVQGLPQRFCADSTLLSIARSLKLEHSQIHEGLLCTGDRFLTSWEEDQAVKKIYPDALACDMESAAVAQVCLHFGVPFLTFRVISDVVSSETNHQQAYDDFWNELKANSFSFLKLLLEKL